MARKYARENPGKNISKITFAEKLREAFLLFYKPLTVINAFKSSGIYPVDSSVISSDIRKSGLTFSNPESVECEAPLSTSIDDQVQTQEQSNAFGALEAL